MISISLIIPVYNTECYLERCLDSILDFNECEIEILLINDGSTDGSALLCKKYELRDKRIKVFHKKNGGLSDARNYGLKKAKGKYVIFIDSDDYLDKKAFLHFLRLAEKYKLDIVTGRGQSINKKNQKVMLENYDTKNKIFTGEKYLKLQFKYQCYPVSACLNMYRRDFLISNRLYFMYGVYFEDEEWNPRVFLEAKRVIGTNCCFYYYIIRENSITTSNNYEKKMNSRLKVCNTALCWVLKLNDIELKKYLISFFVDRYFRTIIFAQKNNKISRNELIYQIAKEEKKKWIWILEKNFYLFACLWRTKRKIFFIGFKFKNLMINIKKYIKLEKNFEWLKKYYMMI